MKQLVRNSIAPMAVGVGGTVFVVGVASVLLAQNFWLADLLVNFQVHFMMCMLVCVFALVLCRRQLTAAAYLMGTLFLALPIIPYLKIPFRETNVAVPTGDEKVYRLLTYNVLRSNTRTQDVADYLAMESVDFLLLLEVDGAWHEEMEFELKDHFPHRFAEPRDDYQGLLLYSKHPWETVRLVSELGSPTVEAKFSLPEGNLHLLGVHPIPPVRPQTAALRNGFLEELGRYASQLPGSVVVAGDFNATPWSPHFRSVLSQGDLVDSGVGRGIQATWFRFPMLFCGLPIDHVVTREVGILRRHIGPPIGSDHRPVTVDFLIGGKN